MSNLKMAHILVLLLLGFFCYFLVGDFIIGIENEDLFVFAYSNNSMKEFFAKTNVNDSEYLKGYVIVDNYKILVDIALTDKQVQDGLSIKNSLNENEGMLFFLGEPRKASFWMKNMKFPIDIIWIDADKTVVHIEHSLQPCSSDLLCPTYSPVDDSLYVLETVGGFAEKHNIAKGTPVDFELSA